MNEMFAVASSLLLVILKILPQIEALFRDAYYVGIKGF